MISEKMRPLVQNNSAIRAMFEEGKRLAGIYGAENVYDFSLGNPNVPAPQGGEAGDPGYAAGGGLDVCPRLYEQRRV